MTKKRAISVSYLYSQVLDGCRHRDNSMIAKALQALIHQSGQSPRLSVKFVQLYRLCLLFLERNRIEEISSTFERMIREWKAALTVITRMHGNRRNQDIEIEPAENGLLRLKTFDSIIAQRLHKMRGARLDSIERLPSGDTLWYFALKRRWLQGVLAQLRTPQYMDFLSKNKSRQLSFEF
ncbi:hypothetical protein ACFL6I_00775 [candidate division KSB1 bacterium]